VHARPDRLGSYYRLGRKPTLRSGAAGRMGLALAVVLLAGQAAEATSWYVRKTGSNLNGGQSAADALLTIGAAATLAQSGDTIYVGAGTYAETVTVPTSGSAGATITYLADVAGGRTGDAGAVIVGNTASLSQGFDISARSYITVQGFTVRGVAKYGIYIGGGSQNVVLRDCEADACGKTGVYLSGASATISRCYLHNNAQYGVYGVNLNGNMDIVRTNIGLNGKGGAYFVNYTGRQLRFTNTVIYANTGQGAYVKSGGATYVVNCTVADNTENGIYAKSLGAIVLHNSILAFNGSYGLSYSKSPLIESHNLLWNGSSAGGGPTDIRADPLFSDRANHNYHIKKASPAVNMADASLAPADDMEGQPRRSQDGTVDMGADEWGRIVRVLTWREVTR